MITPKVLLEEAERCKILARRMPDRRVSDVLRHRADQLCREAESLGLHSASSEVGDLKDFIRRFRVA